MDIEELKTEGLKYFNSFIDTYYEGLEKRFSKKYLRDQFRHFNDAPGKFIYPYLFDVYNFIEREFPEICGNDLPMEDWQKVKFEAYIKEKMSEMIQNFASYMDHCLTLKIYLNFLEVSNG
jgi:hypothetical protein